MVLYSYDSYSYDVNTNKAVAVCCVTLPASVVKQLISWSDIWVKVGSAVTHYMSRDHHSSTAPLATITKNLADIEVRRERGERMNLSENSNVLSGAEYDNNI